MDFGEIFGKIKDFFGDVVNYFKHFKASALYKFGDMIYAIVLFFVAIFKTIK
ncbi:MAG: hypothetical protein IJT44_02160 [Clostridia bacterium]|nr:hypothetical protein [Clostridia bacterium]